MELASEYMEESTHLIAKVVKREVVRKVYSPKIGLAPIMDREHLSHKKEDIWRLQVKYKHAFPSLTS